MNIHRAHVSCRVFPKQNAKLYGRIGRGIIGFGSVSYDSL